MVEVEIKGVIKSKSKSNNRLWMWRLIGALIVVLAAISVNYQWQHYNNFGFIRTPCRCSEDSRKYTGIVEDCCCDYETVDSVNGAVLYPLLQELVTTPFFRYFKVKLWCDCPFWPDDGMCKLRDCSVCECPESEFPEAFKRPSLVGLAKDDLKCQEGKPEAAVDRTLDAKAFRGWPVVDNPWTNDDETDNDEMTYVNLLLNPERYTGYTGPSARRIWDAIYSENCPKYSSGESCQEKKVLYKLISGLHASISVHIASDYLLDESTNQEARALLGRYEYQKGNIEAALHVFEGIDIAIVTPKMKLSLVQKGEPRKRNSYNFADPPLSIHAVGLLLEAIYLKSKSLQILQRYKEAAQSCKTILDIIESSLPEGLPENFGTDCKLQETLNHAVELLPELWKLAGSSQEAVLSFRRALLHHQSLNPETTAKIQKDFAFFLLYNGGEEAVPPNLRSQMDSSFVPRNNIEEAILLLMILLRKVSLKIIKWDPIILDHLSYALSISNGLEALSIQLEELPAGIIDNKERYFLLALCYHGQGDDLSAINLLRNIYKHEDQHCGPGPALLLASKICGLSLSMFEEGVNTGKLAIQALENKCEEMVGVAYYLLAISLSGHCRLSISDLERINKQSEAIECLEMAGKLTGMNDTRIVYSLSLENAEQRKLDAALGYAKRLAKMEGGSSLKGWILLARILSGQKRFSEGETVINAALEQTGKWDQGELLKTKVRLQVAQGQIKNAIQTYTQILAVLQVQNKSFRSQKKSHEIGGKLVKNLEMETWHDLALVYMKLSQWRDAEACLLKSETINYYSAPRLHITGLLYEAKGLEKEAQNAYELALDLDPTYVPSLVSMAVIIRRAGGKSAASAKSFLTEVLRLDRLNSSAWYNLGLFYKEDGPMFLREAANCFEAASILEETEPIEPFR